MRQSGATIVVIVSLLCAVRERSRQYQECFACRSSHSGSRPSLCHPLADWATPRPRRCKRKSIPVVLTARDLLARAQTGTGKTAAFGLPMIDRLLVRGGAPAGRRKPRGLVLVPTRELALQVHKSLATYGVPANLRVTAIFGGVSIGPQMRDLQRGTDIIVATPGRLLDHMEQRTVDLSGVEILTLDEADRMLDMGFLPPLRRILKALPRERQTLLFSATISQEVVRLSAEFTREPHARRRLGGPGRWRQTVTHRVHPVPDQRKGDLLAHVLTQAPVGQALVFCKTKRGSNRVGKYLERAGVKAAVIHGNKSQGARTRALADFKAGRVTRAGGHRHRRARARHRAAAAGRELRPAARGRRLHSPRRPDGPRRVWPDARCRWCRRRDRGLLRGIQRLLPSPVEQSWWKDFAVSASSHEALPEAGRRHQADAGTASVVVPRSGRRQGSGGSGRRPSRPGARASRALRRRIRRRLDPTRSVIASPS